MNEIDRINARGKYIINSLKRIKVGTLLKGANNYYIVVGIEPNYSTYISLRDDIYLVCIDIGKEKTISDIVLKRLLFDSRQRNFNKLGISSTEMNKLLEGSRQINFNKVAVSDIENKRVVKVGEINNSIINLIQTSLYSYTSEYKRLLTYGELISKIGIGTVYEISDGLYYMIMSLNPYTILEVNRPRGKSEKEIIECIINNKNNLHIEEKNRIMLEALIYAKYVTNIQEEKVRNLENKLRILGYWVE